MADVVILLQEFQEISCVAGFAEPDIGSIQLAQRLLDVGFFPAGGKSRDIAADDEGASSRPLTAQATVGGAKLIRRLLQKPRNPVPQTQKSVAVPQQFP